MSRYLRYRTEEGVTGSDNIRVTKTFLRFGPLSFSRVNMPPPADYGRVGDFVLLDNASFKQTPSVQGIWTKVPFGFDNTTFMNATTSQINPPVTPGDVITINGTPVTMTGNTVDTAVADIQNANIPNISAINDGGALMVTSDTPDAIVILQDDVAEKYMLDSIGPAQWTGANGFWVPYGSPSFTSAPPPPYANIIRTDVDYTVNPSDDIVIITDTATTSVTVSLPSTSTYPLGSALVIKSFSPYDVVILPDTGQTVDGKDTIIIPALFNEAGWGSSLTFVPDPANNDWVII